MIADSERPKKSAPPRGGPHLGVVWAALVALLAALPTTALVALAAAPSTALWWVLALTGAIALAIGASAAAVLRSLRRGLEELDDNLSALEQLEFAPRSCAAPFAELASVHERLERAKDALRTLSSYAPIDVIRRLRHEPLTPTLGSERREVTILFSGVTDFTALSEAISEELSPERLAQALGTYLGRLTEAIHATGGSIDRYVGDGLMAVWNAPSAVEAHAHAACQAALACADALDDLFGSSAWEGLPAFPTRLGVHRADVLVGHFGTPARRSYTALGSGVHVANKLEALNKLYGTRILVSQAVYEHAKQDFTFRFVDRVAVRGHDGGLNVYELMGPAGDPRQVLALEYEDALALYFQRSFVRARMMFEAHPKDGPSRAMAKRCRALVERPPLDTWDGVYQAPELR